jgi:hypothetical protein
MSDSKLFKYFAGQHVNIIMKNVKGSQSMSDGSVIRGNVVIEGYLLDEDGVYLYLGVTPEESTEALQKSDVIRIFTVDPEGSEYINIVEDSNNGSLQ